MAEQVLGIVAPVPKGAWDSTITYNSLNIVTYGGAAYISKQSGNLNKEPTVDYDWTDYWQLLVQEAPVYHHSIDVTHEYVPNCHFDIYLSTQMPITTIGDLINVIWEGLHFTRDYDQLAIVTDLTVSNTIEFRYLDNGTMITDDIDGSVITYIVTDTVTQV